MWQALRGHRLEGIHFRRQHPIGPYIVDFCAPKNMLIIELDGGQHLDQEGYDGQRSEYLRARGYRVMRFWNNQVLEDRDGVLCAILDVLEEIKTRNTPSGRRRAGDRHPSG